MDQGDIIWASKLKGLQPLSLDDLLPSSYHSLEEISQDKGRSCAYWFFVDSQVDRSVDG